METLQLLNKAYLNRDDIESPKVYALIVSLLHSCYIYILDSCLFRTKVNFILVIGFYTIFESAENDCVSQSVSQLLYLVAWPNNIENMFSKSC